MRKGINLAAPNGDLAARRRMAAYTGTPPVYNAADLGMGHTDHRRMLSGIESLGAPAYRRTRTPLEPQPELTAVAIVPDDVTPLIQARVLYLMRTQSHLYDDKMADETIDLWRTLAKSDGLLLADCHHCDVTHMVTSDADNCPTCGRDL